MKRILWAVLGVAFVAAGALLLGASGCAKKEPIRTTFAGLVLTEVNPTYDPAGSELGRLVDGLGKALGA